MNDQLTYLYYTKQHDKGIHHYFAAFDGFWFNAPSLFHQIIGHSCDLTNINCMDLLQ